MKTEKQTKIHPCSLEHYDRYRLRNSEGFIIGVGSSSDMVRMRIGDKTSKGGAIGTPEFFAPATK